MMAVRISFLSMNKLLLIFLVFVSCQTQNVPVAEYYDDIDFEQQMFQNPAIFKVDKLIDGDTFWVMNSRREHLKIRLFGIDAPETRTVFKKKKHPFGMTSKLYLDSILLANPYVKLNFDVDSLDQYGRTLAYVYLNDGTFVNEIMVKNGYAVLMTVPPNVKYQEILYKAQVEARERKLGIWREEFLESK